MAEPFKNLIHADGVRAAAAQWRRVWPAFAERVFVQRAVDGLEQLELKARAMQIADALEATLPQDFDRAAGVIEAALAPPLPDDRIGAPATDAQGVTGWMLWPVGEFVARRGLAQPDRALRMLHAITQRFTAEWAIRPFIVAHPATVFATLQRWTADPSAHVRRLVSEGSRPRLPWGLRLQALVADPSPTLPLLRALQDDASDYVRRSVANHLNDISKDHPAVVVAWLKQYLPGADAQRRALLRHASRTLIKAGDAGVLQLWGVGQPFVGRATLALSARRVALGGALELCVRLRSRAASAQRLLVDYAVHHVKADGRTTPRIFKGWQLELPARGEVELVRRHSLRKVTTRRYHGGRHRVEVLVNGQVLAAASFLLETPSIGE